MSVSGSKRVLFIVNMTRQLGGFKGNEYWLSSEKYVFDDDVIVTICL